MGHRRLSYPQQTQLTSEMLNLIDESQVDVPMMVSFDYPFAERLATAVGGIHPLQIADSLLRQGVSVNFVGLDVNLDYWPCGSVFRDPLQWIEMIDLWSQLGLPLIINLRMPTGERMENPPKADGKEKGKGKSSAARINEFRSDMSHQQRLHFIEKIIPVLIARPIVHGLVWTQWRDQDDLRYPFGGLVGADGESKKVLDSIGTAISVMKS